MRVVEIEFDPVKDAGNIVKHGISLRRATDLDVRAALDDDRFDEPRVRLYGIIDGKWYCLAATLRGARVRAISLRRAHRSEVEGYE